MNYPIEFLKKLDADKNKITFIRLTSLDQHDRPVEQIEGRCTGGNLNIDGNSAVRRSCSITLLAQKGESITDVYWAFNTKFKLEIGQQNNIDKNYDNIIWFKGGIFVINSFSKSESTNGQIQLSISGQDKMCRLNGTISGNLPHEVDFGTEQVIDTNGNITINKIPLYKIIQQSVREYAQENLENIIINDLDDFGWELWEYRGDKPMYLFYELGSGTDYGQVVNMTFNGDTMVDANTKISEIEKYYSMNTLDPKYNDDATRILFNGKECVVIKIEYGDTAGYHQVDLVYNNDLICKAGEAVTAMLDKIKNMLGNFEYFYDVDGRFVFQKKATYVQELFSPINGEIVEPTMIVSPYGYKFDDLEMFTTFPESPKVDNVKNDFAVWGKRKGSAGNDLPIHLRCAIDKKPTEYVSVVKRYYVAGDSAPHSQLWYDKTIEEIKYWITSQNQPDEIDLKKFYFDATTGQLYPEFFEWFENQEGIIPYVTYQDKQTYTTDTWDWRELIYQMAWDFYQANTEDNFLSRVEEYNSWAVKGKTGYEQYYSDIQGFWRQLYNPYVGEQYVGADKQEYYTDGDKKYWNKKIHTDPNSLSFWFDFFDPGESAELYKYSVDNIGQRSKVDNQTSTNSIYYKEIPEVQFIVMPTEKEYEWETAYQPIWIQDSMKSLFTRSTQANSALNRLNELIYLHTCTVNGTTFSCIPIYHLQVNTRISVLGQDYTLDKITYNLNHNGMMSMTCTKIIDQFY